MALIKAPLPNKDDVYDPSDYNTDHEKGWNVMAIDENTGLLAPTGQKSLYGNTNMLGAEADWEPLKWDATKNGQVDIRLFYG